MFKQKRWEGRFKPLNAQMCAHGLEEECLLSDGREFYEFVLSSNKSRIRSSAPTVVQKSDKCLLLKPLPVLSHPPSPCCLCLHAALLSARHAVAHCLHTDGNSYQGLPPPAPPPRDGKRPPPPPLLAKRGACLPVHRIKLKHHIRNASYTHMHMYTHTHTHTPHQRSPNTCSTQPPTRSFALILAHMNNFECCPPQALKDNRLKDNRSASIGPQA